MYSTESQMGIHVYPGEYVTAEEYCNIHGIETMLDLDECSLESHEYHELEKYLSDIVYIHVGHDYNANDGKGVYVYLYSREEMNKGAYGEAEIALIRIVDKRLYWHESENGECIGLCIDDSMTARAINQLYKFLLEQFPEADIDMSEARKGEVLMAR